MPLPAKPAIDSNRFDIAPAIIHSGRTVPTIQSRSCWTKKRRPKSRGCFDFTWLNLRNLSRSLTDRDRPKNESGLVKMLLVLLMLVTHLVDGDDDDEVSPCKIGRTSNNVNDLAPRFFFFGPSHCLLPLSLSLSLFFFVYVFVLSNQCRVGPTTTWPFVGLDQLEDPFSSYIFSFLWVPFCWPLDASLS